MSLRSTDDSSPPQGAPQAPPPAIPGHELLRRFAEGHYGEVWLARSHLGTLRAVKILYRKSFEDARPYEREFMGITRFEPVSREHPGLVDILQVGRDNEAGFFYYVMELADNAAGGTEPAASEYIPRSLRHELKTRKRLPAGSVLELALRLADALDFLHRRGLVHRDVKPGNIIFVGGEPKLADAGLVADLGNARTFVGTEGFIPPEGPGTVQADIYSLGKVIYEALTGNDRQDFPDLPADLIAGPERNPVLELNEIALRACAVQREDRYKSLSEMVRDLMALRSGKSLVAARIHRERIRTWGIPLVSAAVLGLFLLLIGLFINNRPRTLLKEDFVIAELNTNLWRLGKDRWPRESTNGGAHSVEFAAGEMLLETVSQAGLSARSDMLWLDLLPDFKILGPVEIDIDMTGSVRGGEVEVGITDGSAPERGEPTGFVSLVGVENDFLSRTEWSGHRFRVQILPASQAALVQTDPLRPDRSRVVPLDTLRSWHLRLWLKSSSGRGLPAAAAEARVNQIIVRELRAEPYCAGRVVDARTRSGITRALLKTQRGATVGVTDQQGSFLILKTALKEPVTVDHEDYQASGPIQVVSATRGRFLELSLVRTNFHVGDVLEAFPLPIEQVFSVSAVTNGFLVAARCSKKEGCFDLLTLTPPFTNAFPELTHYDLPNVASMSRSPADPYVITSQPLTETNRSGVYRLSRNPPVKISPLYDPEGVSIDMVQDCTIEGDNLWFLETDDRNRRYHLVCYDLQDRGVVRCFDLQDPLARGLAWDGERFWIASAGRVYSVERKEIFRQGSVEPGIDHQFPGDYLRLTWKDGQLWGFDSRHNQMCRIKTAE